MAGGGRSSSLWPEDRYFQFPLLAQEHKHLHAKRLENLWSGIHGEHEESSEVKCAGHPRSLSETQHSLLGNGTAAFLSNQVPSAIANQITNLSHGPGGCVDVVLPARSASPEGRHASSSSPCLGFGFWIPLPWPCSARPEREKRLIHWPASPPSSHCDSLLSRTCIRDRDEEQRRGSRCGCLTNATRTEQQGPLLSLPPLPEHWAQQDGSPQPAPARDPTQERESESRRAGQ
ncbi:uncharacterized protein LOC124252512 [Equus quagga]|uniref:uncharacterized protein LOC124252512 n=1 Tax=Equus quagga TaxID=89248 RepID=UPI001EE336C0|nr:uncharacterized protein LOC124252512 [Equus quagga]